MDHPKALGSANRRALRTTLRKEGRPVNTIIHINHGRQNTTRRYKHNGGYGPHHQSPAQQRLDGNSDVLFQGSAISAAVFVIYPEDLARRYHAVDGQKQLPQRSNAQAALTTHTNNLIAYGEAMINNEHENTYNTNDSKKRPLRM